MNNDLEKTIVESLRQIQRRYNQVQLLTNELCEMTPGTPEFQQLHERIQVELTEIEALQTQSRSQYDRYIETRQHASDEVRQITNQLESAIQKLMMQFNAIENKVRESKKQLEPLVNENLRIAKMKSAYRRHTV